MKIAIFRALYLGDMLCIIPAARAIRNAYPQAEVYLVGLPWQRNFVLRFNRYFDYFIEFPGWPGLPEQTYDTTSILSFLEQIRAFQFDLVFQMQGNGVITNTMCMLWDAKTVCGLRKEGEFAPDESLFPVSDDGEHEILRFLKLPACLGIPRCGTHLEFPLLQKEMNTFRKICRQTGIVPGEYICVHPGARDVRRRWPVENFVRISHHMIADGYTLILTGSADEKSLLATLQKKIDGPVINIVESFGHLTAGELACLLKHARLLLSNDTGVSHIAAALQLSSVVLFSPYSDMNRWRPLQEEIHLAIPPEKTGHLEYVIQCVTNKLNEPAARNRDPFTLVQG